MFLRGITESIAIRTEPMSRVSNCGVNFEKIPIQFSDFQAVAMLDIHQIVMADHFEWLHKDTDSTNLSWDQFIWGSAPPKYRSHQDHFVEQCQTWKSLRPLLKVYSICHLWCTIRWGRYRQAQQQALERVEAMPPAGAPDSILFSGWRSHPMTSSGSALRSK